MNLMINLPPEIWEHIFSFVPIYERDHAISSLRRATRFLRGYWVFDEVNLAYLIKRRLYRQRARFIWKCRRYVKYVIDIELGGNPIFEKHPYKSSLMGQFIDGVMFGRNIKIHSHAYESAMRCRCCHKVLINAYFVTMQRHLEGIRGFYTAFELRCAHCQSKKRTLQDYPSVTLLGTTFHGLLESCREMVDEEPENLSESENIASDDPMKFINDFLTSGSTM